MVDRHAGNAVSLAPGTVDEDNASQRRLPEEKVLRSSRLSGCHRVPERAGEFPLEKYLRSVAFQQRRQHCGWLLDEGRYNTLQLQEADPFTYGHRPLL